MGRCLQTVAISALGGRLDETDYAHMLIIASGVGDPRKESQAMPRPHKPRLVGHAPDVVYFKPRGVPLLALEEVVLGFDETEALRLADLEGMSHEQVGERMQISRATAGRILESARRKVADALVNGKALRIADGAAPHQLGVDPDKRAPRPGWRGRGRGRGWGGGGKR
jgi:predicted DNA-binding protein (UPF0251 family)